MPTREIVTVVIALFGGGGISAIVGSVLSHRARVRSSDVEQDQNPLTGFRELVADLRTEVTRLREDRDEDRQRIERIEQQIKVERDTK